MKMFIEVLALQGRKGEGSIRENGALAGIKAVGGEVISSDLDVCFVWRRECSVFEDLGMDTP
jgi:hypothetical protein